jgi:spore maturation protein CgeB
MRILISYFFDEHYIPAGFSLADGFVANGWEVVYFDCFAEHPIWRYGAKPFRGLVKGLGLWELAGQSRYGDKGYKRERFFRALAESEPDVVLVIKAHEFLRACDIERMRSDFGIRVVAGWSIDGPNVKFDLDCEAEMYDLYYSIHKVGSRSARVRRLPLVAVDSTRYFRFNSLFTSRIERAVLVSGRNARRDLWVDGLARARVSVYGDWRNTKDADASFRARLHKRGVWGHNLVDVYNRARIGLNIQGWDPVIDPCCNLRVMDIPACGALLVSEYSDELAEYYKLGVEAESFVESREMLDKIRYYDKRLFKAARVAQKGYERVQRLPTYADRARQIIRDSEGILLKRRDYRHIA